MISNRWQRRAAKVVPEEANRGFLSHAGEKIRLLISSAMFESIDPAAIRFPEERTDNGPFGLVGPNTLHAVKGGMSAAGRTAASPFGALVTVTIADELIRVLTARGNRVRSWAESELPNGVVQDGLIVDEHTFIEVLSDVLEQVNRNDRLKGQKVAIAITGRNLVQRRLTVYLEDDEEIAEAIIAASMDSMSIRTEEMQIEWDAEALDPIDSEDDEYEETEEDEDEDEAEAEAETEATEDEPVHSPVAAEAEMAAPPNPEAADELGFGDLEAALEPEPDGEPYDVYTLALHKHVIRRNLRTVSDFGARFAGVQPKILALAAAVNSRAAVILDFESHTLITAVVSNGLPEVIREVGIDRNMDRAQWVNLISTQITRAVAFYDSIFPDEPLGLNVDVFVTGQTDQVKDAVDEALDKLPFVRSELPPTLRAPAEFSFDKYAANVGLVIVSGKRFWQRAPVPLLPTPKFDYRPAQYRPRPVPWRAALKVAAALIMGIGVFGSIQASAAQTKSLDRAERRLELIDDQIVTRRQNLDNIRDARVLLDEAQVRTERLIAANDAIQDRAVGFSDTMDVIVELAPDDVLVTTIDDDGAVVIVEAKAIEYSILLEFIELLNDVPQFTHVQVLNLSTMVDDDSLIGFLSGLVPLDDSGVNNSVMMSIEISRTDFYSAADEEFLDEQLASAGNQDPAPAGAAQE